MTQSPLDALPQSPLDALPHVLVTYRGEEGENEYVDDVYGPWPSRADAERVADILKAYGQQPVDIKVLTPPREQELPHDLRGMAASVDAEAFDLATTVERYLQSGHEDLRETLTAHLAKILGRPVAHD